MVMLFNGFIKWSAQPQRISQVLFVARLLLNPGPLTLQGNGDASEMCHDSADSAVHVVPDSNGTDQATTLHR